MSGALVTVITPVFNGARYIAEAIESVGRQQVALQHVVVDDGSTDATLAVIAPYADRLTIVRRDHCGHAAALNAGLALVATPWVSFIDADDVLEPGALRCQLAAAASDPQADLIVGHCTEFASGEALDAQSRWTVREGITPGHGPGGVLIRAELLRLLGGFDTAIRYGVFVDLFARAKHLGARTRLIDEVVFRRRIHGGNMSHQHGDARRDYLAIARATLARRRSE